MTSARKRLLRRLRERALARLYRHDLTALATIFQTDKWNAHWHIPHNERYFRPLRSRRLNIEEPRIRIFQGRQEDQEFLRRAAEGIGRVDIVIDDGSHANAHVLAAFETLFPPTRRGFSRTTDRVTD